MARPIDLSGIPVVDGHGHPLLRDPANVSREVFLDLFTEGRAGTMRDHVPHTGYYRRALRALAGRLGVAPTADAVLEAGRRLTPDAVRAQLTEADVAALLVDTRPVSGAALPRSGRGPTADRDPLTGAGEQAHVRLRRGGAP